VDLTRLLAPRSIAVVGASTRLGTYGNQAVANLVANGFPGEVFGVHPSATAVHGVPCVPRLADLPVGPDAVIIATPAATVPALLAEAGELGAGGAVVFAAGFAEAGVAGRELQERLREAAQRYRIPVCGPNGNGIVSLAARAPMWGDSCTITRSGPIAMVSQSGNVAVNALASTRALRLHTVVSCGNQAVLDAADYLDAIAGLAGVRAVALYLEADGDGAKLADAFARCAEHDVRVVVLKAGASPLGASAAASHTGSVAGDARVLRAVVEEAGGVWAHHPHELLELAKALGYARRAPRAGTVIVTCSGGDAAIGADEADRLGVPLPELDAGTVAALRAVLPANATAANPLDYTAVIFGAVEPTAEVVAAAGADPAVGCVLVYYDRPGDLDADAAVSWDDALAGVMAGAARLDKPVLLASTLPELMPGTVAERLVDAGVVPIAGLREGVRCAGVLHRPAADPGRLRAIARAAGRAAIGGAAAAGDGWLAEHEAKELLRGAGIRTPPGHLVRDADAAVAAARRLGDAVALKLSAPDIQHKSDLGAILLGVRGEAAVRAAFAKLQALPGRCGTPVLVESMCPPGVEIMIAVRRDGLVPVLVVALGGVWVEVLDDAVLLPLPVDPAAVRDGLRRLRAAPLFTGGRGRPAVDLDALSDLAARVAGLAERADLELIELNPVFARPDGATAIDAVARRAVATP
jgi:acetate---CoA ligase (ADP-forming)